MIWRIFGCFGIVAILLFVIFIFSYEVIAIDFGSFMEKQKSVKVDEPPLALPPDEAWAFDRPDYTAIVQSMSNPVPADAVSLQRGALLFRSNCEVCHGPLGAGNGPVTQFWQPNARRPANLTDPRFRQYPDGLLFSEITNGIGTMPPMRENLTERQRWDVVNHIRTFSPTR